MRTTISFDPSVRPVYAHLEPIVDLLLANGNQLARPYRWGENRTGYYCFLSKPIDFDLIESAFVLPQTVSLDRSEGSVECDVTWASIKGDMRPPRTAGIGQERSFDFEIKDFMNDSPDKKDNKFIGVGIALGVAIGCAIGLAIGNLALGIGPGIAIGLAIGAWMSKSRR